MDLAQIYWLKEEQQLIYRKKVDKQRLIICIVVSIIVSKLDINNLEGKGSDEHVVLFITDTILINSSLVIIVNLSNKFAQVGIMGSTDPNE